MSDILLKFNEMIDNDKILKVINDTFDKDKINIIHLTHVWLGGMHKHIIDLIKKIELPRNKYNIICNNNDIVKRVNNFNREETKYIDSIHILKCLQHEYMKKYEIILHVHIFTEYFNILTKEEIYYILCNIKYTKLYITIHDYFWINPSDPTLTIEQLNILQLTDNEILLIEKIFKLSNKIIFPSENTFKLYLSKNINIINYDIQNHIDINTNLISPYYSKIYDNVIKIGIIGTISIYKGYKLILDILKNIDKKYLIDIYFIGYIHKQKIDISLETININYLGYYENENLIDIINQIKPNLFILSSLCYETWSYVASVVLSTGLPIFYNSLAYHERIKGRSNTFEFKSSSTIYNISEDFLKCLNKLITEEQIEYISLFNSEEIVPNFYKTLY